MNNPSPLCRYEDFRDVLPHAISRRQILRLADTGRFPPYARVGFKGEPCFAEQAVIQFIKDKYERVLPEFCRRLDEEGLAARPFPEANSTLSREQNRQPQTDRDP